MIFDCIADRDLCIADPFRWRNDWNEIMGALDVEIEAAKSKMKLDLFSIARWLSVAYRVENRARIMILPALEPGQVVT